MKEGISVLGCEIGRGHPFYSDGLVSALQQAGADVLISRRTDVFRVSRGLSRAAWQAVRASYHRAGRGGLLAAAYRRLRGSVDYDRESLLLRVLGWDLRGWAGTDGVLVVDHPAVVGALGGRPDVWYFHGELVAPPEAIVHRAARVLVPREDVAGEFVRGGLHPEQVLVTGLCVENALVDDALRCADERRRRIAGETPLTVGLFSSGSEPVSHVRTLAAAARSLGRSPHRAVAFARRGGVLAAELEGGNGAPDLETFRDRADLERVTAVRFPKLDVVISPPHERSHWAVGLGVPFLLVGPDVGPFAPRNRSLLLRAGVAAEISGPAEAADLPRRLDELRRSGHLLRMSENGGGVSVDGFRRAAGMLVREAERRGIRHAPPSFA